jgi:hypothetical protein
MLSAFSTQDTTPPEAPSSHSNLLSDKRNIVVYVDSRTLGSTAQFSDPTISLPTRCISLFRDFLGEIHNELLDHIVTLPCESAEAALEHLSEFSRISTEHFTKTVADRAEHRVVEKETEKGNISLSVAIDKIDVRNCFETESSKSAKDLLVTPFCEKTRLCFQRLPPSSNQF